MFKQSKSVTVAYLMLCLALLLSACTSHAPNLQAPSGKQSSSATTSAPPSSAQTKTKVISTINGDIEIPDHPNRIVADQYLGSFIALGVIPIGAPGLHRQNPYLAEALKAVEDTGDVTGSLEKVVELQPDLIVTGDTQNRYESLSKIAPTISIPYGNLKNAHEELTYFGKLLGREKEAEAWLADYDQRIAAAKEKVKKVIPENATFSILESAEKNTYAYGENFGRGGQAVYQALGLKPPAAVAKDIFEKQWAELSNELLPKYAGDYIILTSNDRTIEDLKADPIWSTFDAVKNNRVYIWKEERSWYYDPIAVLSQTEEIAAWLTKEQ
ncbi:iron-hydroxamate ABC transporter substrate-binding protein [Brevibacillus reuszeri]